MMSTLSRTVGTLLALLALSACVSVNEPYLPAAAPNPILMPARPAPPAPAERAPRTTPVVANRTLQGPADEIGKPADSVLIPLSQTGVTADSASSASAVTAYPDLMERIRAGFKLPEEYRSAVDVQLAWYERNPEYLDRVFGRASLYMHYIVEEIERRGMPMELALLPVVESAFEPFAYSKARASGLWQFIPDTGNRFGLPQNWWYDGRRDVIESTRAALDYLQFLHDEFNGDWLLAVAGYNCGERCVARAVARNESMGRPTSFWDLSLPGETRAYVPKLLAMKRVVADPASLGIEFSPIPNEPYFTRVAVGSQIDLRLAADLAGLSHEELSELNPAFHRWATPPQGPHTLLLPIDSADIFQQNMTQLTADELLRVNHHVVQAGETLAELATRYSTNVMTIRMLNGLKDASVEPGMDLRVPSGTTQLPEKVLRAAARVDGPEPKVRKKRGRPEVHVVRRGESIWAIARRNGIDPRTLMRLNGKKPGDKIKPGERLIVSASGGSSGSSSNRREGASSSRLTHRVSRGETLSSIARRYGVTISQLTAWNDISARQVLRVGQRLTIRTRN